ncbi:MAG: peptidoglycan editing factor PgeF [Clostridia bacterium]|nr:peptidoglycan editing factor PgeF [Clostridia bacterium]
MQQYKTNGRLYLQSEPFLLTRRVSHGFTSRLGGVSHGKIEGLNLGFRVGDNPDDVMENYRLVAEDLGLNLSHTVLAKQTHTDCIRLITPEDMGKGISKPSDIEDTDGLMTNLKGVPLVVFSADCIPLLFLDPEKEVIAAVHAGWRGTLKEIGKKAVAMMEREFDCNPQDILAAIGPGIGPCCFAFGKKDAEIFPPEFVRETSPDKVLVDIWEMNRNQLLDAGLSPKNIDMSGVCTVCQQHQFYSYRTHKEHTGRQGAVIMLR